MSVNIVCSAVYKRRLKLYHPYVNMSQKGYCLLWAKDNLKWTVYIHFTQCPNPSQVSINSCNFFSIREKLIKLPDSESETSQSNRYKMCWLQITFYMESLWTPLIFFICAQFAVIASLLDWKCLGASQKDCWCSVGFDLRFSLCHFFFFFTII